MNGDLPFLNDEVLPEEAEAEQPQVEAEEAKGEEPAAPPVAQDETKHIPISALLDEREKRQAAAREAEELRKRLEAYEAQKQQPPDFYENPEQRLAMERAQMQHVLWNERLNTSEMIARNAHGDDAVDAARDAFMAEAERNPTLRAELQRQQNPYGYVVNWHKRQAVLSRLGDDPEAYIQAEVQRRLQEAQAAPKPAAPPASLAAAPAAGTGQKTAKSGFDALFGG